MKLCLPLHVRGLLWREGLCSFCIPRGNAEISGSLWRVLLPYSPDQYVVGQTLSLLGGMSCSGANLLRHVYLQMAPLRPSARPLMGILPFGYFFLQTLMTSDEHLCLVYLYELAVKGSSPYW